MVYGAFAAADVAEADGGAISISTSPPLTRSARVDSVRMSSFFDLLCAPAARPLVCSARRMAIAARAALFMPRIIGDWGLGVRDWGDWGLRIGGIGEWGLGVGIRDSGFGRRGPENAEKTGSASSAPSAVALLQNTKRKPVDA